MNKIEGKLWQVKSRHTGEIMPCVYSSIEDAFKYKSLNDYELIEAVKTSVIMKDYEKKTLAARLACMIDNYIQGKLKSG